MQTVSATKRVAAFAIALAIASAVPPSANAQPIPSFDCVLDVPGPPDPNVNIDLSPAPIIQAINGTDGSFGSGSAFGRAQLGNLGARAMVQNTAPTIDVDTAAGSRVYVAFFDSFAVNFPGVIGNGVLSITASLDGTSIVTGDPDANRPNVEFTIDGGDLDLGNLGSNQSARLFGPGTVTIQIPTAVGRLDYVNLRENLDVDSQAIGPGTVITDFSNSAKINAVQLFDTQGHFIQDVTLVDDAGNVLPVFPVPEPRSAALLLFGLAILGMGAVVAGKAKRRPGRCRPPSRAA